MGAGSLRDPPDRATESAIRGPTRHLRFLDQQGRAPDDGDIDEHPLATRRAEVDHERKLPLEEVPDFETATR